MNFKPKLVLIRSWVISKKGVVCLPWIKTDEVQAKTMAYYVIHTLDFAYVPWYCESMEHALNIFLKLHEEHPELSGMLEIQDQK